MGTDRNRCLNTTRRGHLPRRRSLPGPGRTALIAVLAGLHSGLGGGDALAEGWVPGHAACSRTQVIERGYGNLLASATPPGSGNGDSVSRNLRISLSNGLTLQGQEAIDDTTFWSNFAPGHAVDLCRLAAGSDHGGSASRIRYSLHDSVTGFQVNGFTAVEPGSGS